jgi:hypothetical protein
MLQPLKKRNEDSKLVTKFITEEATKGTKKEPSEEKLKNPVALL